MSEKLADEFFVERHADGATYFAKRGNTNVKAVDWDEEKDRLYPVVPEMDRAKERDWGFKQVDRSEVPDRIEEHLEDRFVSREELEEALRSAPKSSLKSDKGGNSAE